MTDNNDPPRNPEDTDRRAENNDRPPEGDYAARVRATLSFIVIVGFALTAVVVVILQYFRGAPDGAENLPTLETVGSIYAGVTGAVLGYWFGKEK